MVVFNDEIHTARNVTKTHTSNINTFQSPNHGPLGVLTKDRVQFHNHPYRQTSFKSINHQLKVPLIKAYMGMESDLLDFYANQEIDGLVIEALGQGNLLRHVYLDFSIVLIRASRLYLFQDHLMVLLAQYMLMKVAVLIYLKRSHLFKWIKRT